MDFKSLAKRLNNDIKDSKLKKLLFGDEEIEAFEISNIGTLYRVLTFIFLFIYIQYKYKKINGEEFSNSQNSKRVYSALDNIYVTENIELSLMFYVVKEALIDEDKNMRRSDFAKVINSHSDINNIIEIDNIIKVWMQSAKTAEANLKKLADLLDYLITTFEALPYIKINEEENGYVGFEFEKNGIKYPSYGITKIINGELYYLYNYDTIGKNVSANYKKIGSYDVMQNEQIEKSSFGKILQNRPPKNPSKILIKNTFPKEYAYLNNLTLAISETLTDENKQELFYLFRDKYPYIFSMDNKIDIKAIDYNDASLDNWDEIISMLILEISPTELLRSVLSSYGFNFEQFVDNVGIRYGDSSIYKSVLESVKNYEIIEKKNAEKFNVQITKEKQIFDKIKINCKIKSIMECLSKKEKIAYESFSNEFVGTIEVIKERILQIENSSDSIKAKTVDINYLLEGIFRYLLCFYRGVIAFGKNKTKLQNEVMAEKDINVDNIYKECKNAFFSEIDNCKKVFSSMSIGELIGAVREFSKNIYDGSKITDDSRALYEIIGRYSFINMKLLEDILSFSDAEAKEYFINSDDKKLVKNMVTYINLAKHNKPDYPKLSEKSFVLFSKHVNNLLDYLMYGDDMSSEFNQEHVSSRPIFPYVVYYSYSVKNRDGIKIPQFSVSLTTKSGKGIEKKILSGVDYDISKKYYCLPNNSTSNEYWWIEPFLIDSSEFDRNMDINFNNNAKDKDDENFETNQ